MSKYTDIGSRSQVVRNLLANKRALIVLDNAQNSKQLTPLLPPSGHCAVLITTRHRYLSATRGARRFLVKPFNQAKGEAFELFTALLRPKRAYAKREALNEIADLLGHLTCL